MVAVFTGQGAGFERGSAAQVGAGGVLGSGAQGRGGDVISVNAATGNLLINRQDEFLVGRGPDVGISRTYNSLGALDENGDHWRQSTDRRIVSFTGTKNTAGATLKRISADGSEITYTYKNNDGEWAYWTTDGAGAHDKIEYLTGKITWTDGTSGIQETYLGIGGYWRIYDVVDRDGNTARHHYDGNGRLLKIATSGANAGYLKYTWSGNNITSIETYADGGSTKTHTRTGYVYDSQNRLVKVVTDLDLTDSAKINTSNPNASHVNGNLLASNAKAYTTTYTYHGTTDRIASITQTDGSRVEFTYDGSGRVTHITQKPGNGEPDRITELSYRANNTHVIAPNGHETAMWYDGKKQLTLIRQLPPQSGASDQRTSFTYDSSGNVKTVTDAEGKVTTFWYDANGNRIQKSDGQGSITAYKYDDHNQLIRTHYKASAEHTADSWMISHNVYDGEGHLRYTINGKGGVTEYRYSSEGNLIWEIDYTLHSRSVSWDTPSVADMDAWRNALDRSNTSMIGYGYDARGNRTQMVDYGYANANGGANVHEGYSHSYYTHDSSGNLLTSRTASAGTETYSYDGMGRLIASNTLDGGATSIVFDDKNTKTIVTSSLGGITTKTYNKAGNLISVTDSGDALLNGGSSNYVYDKNGRLRKETDATGVKTYYVYDKVGNLTAKVDSLGQLEEFRYDKNGRQIAHARYYHYKAGADRTALIAALDNPNNTLEAKDVRKFSDQVENNHWLDIWEWTGYDSKGRAIRTILGDGTVTSYEYDNANQLVATKGYINKLSATQLANLRNQTASAIDYLPTAHSKDTLIRTFYDRAGRVAGSLNAEGALSRNIYDKAGRLIETISYYNATNATAAQRESFTLNQLINATPKSSAKDVVTRNVYDGQNHLRYSIDALGKVMEYVYRPEGGTNWHAIGPVRATIQHAASLGSVSDYKFATIKAKVASLGSKANNRTTWNVYNTKNQLVYNIDAHGTVTQFKYDSLGNVIKTTQFAQERVTTSLPSEAVMNGWAATYGADARITRNYYNKAGQLRFTIDPEGYVTRIDYDKQGRVSANIRFTKAVNATDSWTTATVNGQRTTSGNSDWVQERFIYDHRGRVLYQYDANNVRTYTNYWANGERAWVRTAQDGSENNEKWVLHYNDRAGRHYLTSEYSGSFHSVHSADPDFRKHRRTFTYYDGLGNVSRILHDTRYYDNSQPDHNTYFTYDKNGNVLTEKNPAGGITSYEYNAFGQVTKQTDPRGFSTEYIYDSVGRLSTSTDPEGIVTTTTYTAFGEVATVTRGDQKTTFGYDKLGRVISKTVGPKTGGVLTKEEYVLNAFGQIETKYEWITTNGSSKRTTHYKYDDRGLLIEERLSALVHEKKDNTSWSMIQKGDHVVTEYEYDSRGNRIKMIEGYDNGSTRTEGRTTTYTYDAADRLIETKGEAVAVLAGAANATSTTTVTPTETLTYDKRGNVVTKVDPTGARTSYFYDGLNRLTHQVSPTGVLTVNTYDMFDNIVETKVYANKVSLPAIGSVTPPSAPAVNSNDRVTEFSYDKLGRMTESRVPSIQVFDYNGSSVSTTTKTLTTKYEYDANGNVIKVTDPNGKSTYSYYDAAGRKYAQVDTDGYLTTWSYDAVGNVEQERRFAQKPTGTISVNSHGSIKYNWPTGTGAEAFNQTYQDRITDYTYDALGRKLSETRQNVLVDNNGAFNVADSIVRFEYNAQGNITKKTEATGDVTQYVYDRAGRLYYKKTTAFQDFKNTSSNVTPSTYYLYSGLQEIAYTRNTGKTGVVSHRYTRSHFDDAGRLYQTQDAQGYVTTYRYDEAGRVVREEYTRATATKGTQTEAMLYEYDAEGRVVKQGIGVYTGSAWVWGDTSGSTRDTEIRETVYNSFGNVITRKINGKTSETSTYDKAGRLIKTTAGDGVARIFGYDANGNQTIALSPNTQSLASKTLSSAISTMGGISKVLNNGNNNAIAATVTQYDNRGNAIKVIEPGRELKAGTFKTLTTTRSYNAFGDVTSETSAYRNDAGQRTATIDYYYNTMGRKIRIQSPFVDVYDEFGNSENKRPTEYLYYDVSGRQVANRDGNGNLTRQEYLVGTGYEGSQGLVTKVIYADLSTVETTYDMQGDARVIKDQLGRITEQTFDKLGRVTIIEHPSGLTETYSYDSKGNKYKTTYNDTGDNKISVSLTNIKEDYDAMGRVTRRQDVGGDVTTFTYEWDASETTPGVGSFGAWQIDTRNEAGRTDRTNKDIFGRVVYNNDYGGHTTNYNFDLAGRLTSKTGSGTEDTTYTYFNTGKVARSVEKSGPQNSSYSTWREATATFGYNEMGQLASDRLSVRGRQVDAVSFSKANISYPNTRYYGATTFRNATAKYDELGRMVEWKEHGVAASSGRVGVPNAFRTYAYDANSNVRNAYANYARLNSDGSVSTTANSTADLWYLFDSMNRVVVNDGIRRNGEIVLGSQGTLIEYDAAGRRYKVTRGGPYANGSNIGSGAFQIESNQTVNEGDTVVFTVKRTGDLSKATAVQLVTTGGTATANSDYVRYAQTITFSEGQESQEVRISTNDDDTPEQAETFNLRIERVSGAATIATAQRTATIRASDELAGSGEFRINNVNVNEGGTATFTVSRTGDTAWATTLDWATALTGTGAGHATTADFTSASGSLSFGSGVASRQITVATKQDSTAEGAETFKVNLSNLSGGSFADSVGVATIAASDQPVDNSDYSITNHVGGNEGDLFTFYVTRNGTNMASSVRWTLDKGDAYSNLNGVATSGTLNFAAGDGSETIRIQTQRDYIDQNYQFTSFSITLSQNSGGTIVDSTGYGLVSDIDGGSGPIQLHSVTGTGPELAALDSSMNNEPSLEPSSNPIIDEPDSKYVLAPVQSLNSTQNNEFEREPDDPFDPDDPWGPGGTTNITGTEEVYAYEADSDNIRRVDVNRLTYNDSGVVTASSHTGYSTFFYDGFGRKTSQSDWSKLGSSWKRVFSESVTYNTKGQSTYQTNTTLRSDGDTVTSWTKSFYRGEEVDRYGNVQAAYQGSDSLYALGQATLTFTASRVNNDDTSYSGTYHRYTWFNGARQDSSYHSTRGKKIVVAATYARNRDFAGAKQHDDVNYTDYLLSESGRTLNAVIEDKRDRVAVLDHDTSGQIIRRDERDDETDSREYDPVSHFHRFEGREMGMTSNDSSNGGRGFTDSYSDRRQKDEQYAFNNGSRYALPSSDFSQGLDMYDSYTQGSPGGVGSGGYVAQGGETLMQVASNLWGDSSLWYKIAGANGFSGDQTLVAGQSIRLPSGVQRNTFNASTVAPYDAAEATGDLSPTNAQPGKKNKCGVFGQILLVVIAVAVTVLSAGALGAAAATGLNAVLIGAASGAAGSIASQVVGVATGIQEKFSFKGVAMAAIGGGIGAGLGGIGALNNATTTLGRAAQAGIRGAIGSAATQGIGVATGLQDSFSWAGVAAAGVGAFAGQGIGDMIGDGAEYASDLNKGARASLEKQLGRSLFNSDVIQKASFSNQVLSSTAGAIANAATRSAINGSNFGDNIVKAIPDVVGSAIGGVIGSELSSFMKTFLESPTKSNRSGELRFKRKQYAQNAQAAPQTVTDVAPFEISSGGLKVVEPANDNRPPRRGSGVGKLFKSLGINKAASLFKSGWSKDTITVSGGDLAGELDFTLYNGRTTTFSVEQFVDGKSVYREDVQGGLVIAEGDQGVIGLKLPSDSPLAATFGVGNFFTFSGNRVGTDVGSFFVDSNLEAYGIASAIAYGESIATAQNTVTTLLNDPSSFDERSPAHRDIALTAYLEHAYKRRGPDDEGVNSVRVQLQGSKVRGGDKDSTGGRIHSNVIALPGSVPGLVAHGQLIALHEQAYGRNIRRGGNGPEILLRLSQAHQFIRSVSGVGVRGTDNFSFPNNNTPQGRAIGGQLRVDVEVFDNTGQGNLR